MLSWVLGHRTLAKWLIRFPLPVALLVACASSEPPNWDVQPTDVAGTKQSQVLTLVATTSTTSPKANPTEGPTALTTVVVIQTAQPGSPGRDEVVKPSDDQRTAQPAPLPTVVLPAPPELPLNTAEDAILAVQSQDARVADISDTPDTLIGKSHDIHILPQEDDGWRLVFWRGWGDCPAGCINSHYWYFSVARDGVIELIGEYERVYEPRLNRHRETGEPLWGIPH